MSTGAPTSLPGGGQNRFWSQKSAESSLAPHPYRLELRGRPNELTWPRVCAACGGTATEQVTVRKALSRRRSRRRSGASIRIVPLPLPLCSGCAHEHRSTVERPSTVGNLLGTLIHPIMIPIVGAAFFGNIAFKEARGLSLAEPAGQIGWGLVALMAFIIVWTSVLWWRVTRPGRLEPQTEITRSCDFSGDVSQMFERERHIYSMRNETFARAFETANLDARWTDADQARSRRLSPLIALGLLLALAAVATVLTMLER